MSKQPAARSNPAASIRLNMLHLPPRRRRILNSFIAVEVVLLVVALVCYYLPSHHPDLGPAHSPAADDGHLIAVLLLGMAALAVASSNKAQFQMDVSASLSAIGGSGLALTLWITQCWIGPHLMEDIEASPSEWLFVGSLAAILLIGIGHAVTVVLLYRRTRAKLLALDL